MKSVPALKVKIFADGADKAAMMKLYQSPYILSGHPKSGQ